MGEKKNEMEKKEKKRKKKIKKEAKMVKKKERDMRWTTIARMRWKEIRF